MIKDIGTVILWMMFFEWVFEPIQRIIRAWRQK